MFINLTAFVLEIAKQVNRRLTEDFGEPEISIAKAFGGGYRLTVSVVKNGRLYNHQRVFQDIDQKIAERDIVQTARYAVDMVETLRMYIQGKENDAANP